MKKVMILPLAFVFTLLISFSAYASPVGYVGKINTDNAIVIGSVGDIDYVTNGYFWKKDDGFTESYADTGFDYVTAFSVDLFVPINVLRGSMDWGIFINDSMVDQWTLSGCDGTGLFSLDSSFLPVYADDGLFTVSMKVENTVLPGLGSNAFGKGMDFSMTGKSTPVPEPTTMLLFSTGLIGLVGLSCRKKKK